MQPHPTPGQRFPSHAKRAHHKAGGFEAGYAMVLLVADSSFDLGENKILPE
jgi:hypothetical protein